MPFKPQAAGEHRGNHQKGDVVVFLVVADGPGALGGEAFPSGMHLPLPWAMQKHPAASCHLKVRLLAAIVEQDPHRPPLPAAAKHGDCCLAIIDVEIDRPVFTLGPLLRWELKQRRRLANSFAAVAGGGLDDRITEHGREPCRVACRDWLSARAQQPQRGSDRFLPALLSLAGKRLLCLGPLGGGCSGISDVGPAGNTADDSS